MHIINGTRWLARASEMLDANLTGWCGCGETPDMIPVLLANLPRIFMTMQLWVEKQTWSLWPRIYLASWRSPHTRSSPYVTLIKPSSSLKVTHWSFRHASPHLWNQLPTSLRIPHPNIRLLIPLSATFIWTCRFNLLHYYPSTGWPKKVSHHQFFKKSH